MFVTEHRRCHVQGWRCCAYWLHNFSACIRRKLLRVTWRDVKCKIMEIKCPLCKLSPVHKFDRSQWPWASGHELASQAGLKRKQCQHVAIFPEPVSIPRVLLFDNEAIWIAGINRGGDSRAVFIDERLCNADNNFTSWILLRFRLVKAFPPPTSLQIRWGIHAEESGVSCTCPLWC